MADAEMVRHRKAAAEDGLLRRLDETPAGVTVRRGTDEHLAAIRLGAQRMVSFAFTESPQHVLVTRKKGGG